MRLVGKFADVSKFVFDVLRVRAGKQDKGAPSNDSRRFTGFAVCYRAINTNSALQMRSTVALELQVN